MHALFLFSTVSVMSSGIDVLLSNFVKYGLKALLLCVNSQLRARVSVCGIQWIDSTVAVVVSSGPHLVSQLERNAPSAGGNVPPGPQVHLTAKIKHQSLDGRTQSH